MFGVLSFSLVCTFQFAGGICNFPNGFLGNWKSSNYGNFTFGTSSMYMSTDITGSDKRNYTCESNSGTKYVIRTTESFSPFIGATTYFYAYICLDLRQTSAYSYYYYQQSSKDIGFNYERAKAFNTTGISLNAVCETTVDVTEYHVMVKEGYGKSVQVTCPDIFLGVFYYNYSDSTNSYCNGVSTLDVCNNNKTTLIFNYTLCSKMVGFSAGGILGCIASVVSGSNTYLTTYNQDAMVDGSTTTTFACFAATTVGSSVVASIRQTECSLHQSPSTLPTGGGILSMTANYTCLPVTTTSETKNYTWIIVGSILGFLALVGIILFLIYCLCFWWPKRKKERRIRAKKIIDNEDKHPFAESSLTLDAPSLYENKSELKNEHIYEKERTTYITDVPSNRQDESTSVKIDFRGKTWIKGDKPSSNGGPIMNGINSVDPSRELAISEIDTVSIIPHRLEEKFFTRATSPSTTVTQSSQPRSLKDKPDSNRLPPLATSDSSVKRGYVDKSSKHGDKRKSGIAWTDNSDSASFFEARLQHKRRGRRRGYLIQLASRSHTPASRSSKSRSTRSSFYDNRIDTGDGEWEDEEVEEIEHNGRVKNKSIIVDSRRSTKLPPISTVTKSKTRQSHKQQKRKRSRQSNRSRSRGSRSDRIKSYRQSLYRNRMSNKPFSNGQAKQLQRSRTMSGHMGRSLKPFKKTKHDSIGIRLHRSYTEASIRKVNHDQQLRPNYVHTAWR